MLFGHAPYFSDTLSYYKGGAVAAHYAVAKERALVGHLKSGEGRPNAGDARSTLAAGPAEEAKGARSIAYSVLTYALRAPAATLSLLALFQSLTVALVIVLFIAIVRPLKRLPFLALCALLAAATPLAPFANFAMPDVYAGVLIVIMIGLTLYQQRLSPGARLLWVLLGALAVTVHASHPPLAAGLALLGVAWLLLGKTDGQRRWRAILLLLAPLILGSMITLGTNKIGFGTASLAAKRFPLTLARSIEDGPARWYLQRHCHDHRYAVCEIFGDRIPSTVNAFLWGPSGLDGRASPEQMDRVRAQEQEIVLAAAAEFPAAQTSHMADNILLQLGKFKLSDLHFHEQIAIHPDGIPYFRKKAPTHRWAIRANEILTVILLVLSIMLIAWRFREMDTRARLAVILLAAGILGNAIICAVFSAPADRYGARVIWLIPLFSLLLAKLPFSARPKTDQVFGPSV
jgi:hypothetical protein